MVISCDHVFGPKVDEGDDFHPPDFLNVARVTSGDVMGKGLRCSQHERCKQDKGKRKGAAGCHGAQDPQSRGHGCISDM